MLPSGTVVNIDEKAQVDYLKSPLPTYVLELGFTSAAGKRETGWFINDGLLTDLYLFVWPYADADKRTLSVEDVTRCECMTVPKAALRRALGEEGWTAANLEKLDAALCAEKPFKGSHPLKDVRCVKAWEGVEDVPGVKACRSNHLAEDPVNLVVRKDFLARFATGHYMVYPSVVEVMERPKNFAKRTIPTGRDYMVG